MSDLAHLADPQHQAKLDRAAAMKAQWVKEDAKDLDVYGYLRNLRGES